MRIVPVIALAASLGVTAAIAPSGSPHSAPTTALSVYAGAWSASANQILEVRARKWKTDRRRVYAEANMNRRRGLASRRRFVPSGRRAEENNLPPNLGIGIGTGF